MISHLRHNDSQEASCLYSAGSNSFELSEIVSCLFIQKTESLVNNGSGVKKLQLTPKDISKMGWKNSASQYCCLCKSKLKKY